MVIDNPGESIGLKLEAKSDSFGSDDINQMIQRIRQIVEEYDYKISSHGKWNCFKKWLQESQKE